MINYKHETGLIILGFLILVVGFFNLICFVNKYVDKSVVEKNNQISELLTVEHLNLNSVSTALDIEKEIEKCYKYKFYLENIKLNEKSDNYKENKTNIEKELENVQQILGIYYCRYKDLNQKKIKEEITTIKVSETTTSPNKSTTNTQKKETTTKAPLITITKPSTTQKSSIVTDKYSNATIIWNYLRNLGYNKYVCAGIIGNIMTEVGGQTLEIRPGLYDESGNYYGICQWSLKYYPSIEGRSLTTQLNFLAETIKYEFNTYGHLYYSGFDYSAFLNLNNASETALAFAKVYERCSSDSYVKRQNNASIAYNYFVN